VINFPTKPVGAGYDLPFDFISLLPLGVALVSAAITAVVESGEDDDVEILNGAGVISGTVVNVPVHAGVAGVIYKISVLATADDDNIYPLSGFLAVV
jgi:hypothetical protein